MNRVVHVVFLVFVFLLVKNLPANAGDTGDTSLIPGWERSPDHVQVFVNPWTAAHQAPLSSTIFWSLLKLMSIESVMPSNHLILCHPLLLLPSILLSIRVFSNDLTLHIRWPKYWTFSFSISPSNEYSGLISFRTVWLHLLAVQGIPDTGIGDKKRHNHKICETKH